MNLEDKNLNKLKCEICNKFYASQYSLNHHNRKFHKKTIINNVNNIESPVNLLVNNIESPVNLLVNNIESPNLIVNNIESSNLLVNNIESSNLIVNNIESSNLIVNNKIIKCDHCNAIFSSRQAKYLHKKKTCKFNNNDNDLSSNINKLHILEKKNIELEKKNDEIINSLKELKELFIKNCKIHPKTLKKINKNLINLPNNIINSNNTINNTINNNTIINKTYVNFHNPIDYKLLSEREILNILNRPWKSLEESIKTIHFNKKLPEYNNILITNLKDTTAYIFDGLQFSAISKNEAINELINSHMDEIESSVTEYEDKISETKLKHFNNFINMISDNDKKYIHDGFKKTYPNYRIYKCDLIKNLIYNNSDTKLLEKLKNMDLKNKIISEIR